MSDSLDRLAGLVGVETEFRTLTGDLQRVSDAAKRGALKAMGIAAATDEEIERSLKSVTPVLHKGMAAPDGEPCFMPDWLQDGRCWGIACQLYSLRSARNCGIGDFTDLAQFCDLAAKSGADFVGVNPLHALFMADPQRCSPFFPSTRQFLNPLYIALDAAPFAARLGDALDAPAELRAAELVDYRAVGAFKRQALKRLFEIFRNEDDADLTADLERFTTRRGQALYLHALFEALSEAMAQQGHGATWHGWPADYAHPATDAVRAFSEEQADLVAFHIWLQWLADRQLRDTQRRAGEAGLRIGLYLDLAVGVAPDGSATWSDRDLTVPAARIGAPPDYYNAAGQDWGLAPLSPEALVERAFRPYRESIGAVLSHAGALRIDHAMSLYRLFWIGEGLGAADGTYVRYPFTEMLRTLADLSRENRSIVIGEDLGVVPPGFRDVMRDMHILGYRVFFFEKQSDMFLPPDAYPRAALACVTTHDLHTLAGWWTEHDIDVRAEIGMLLPGDVAAERTARAHERRRLLGTLAEHDLLPEALVSVMRGEHEPPPLLPPDLAVALHRLVARTPSRLFVMAAEDLAGSEGQVNIPGTMDEHPNWRRKLPVDLDDFADGALFRRLTDALTQERPRQ